MTTDPAARPSKASGPAPGETPEGEGSTTHGISIPEPPELHNAWPSWVPIVVIAALVVAVVIFMAARIAA